MYNERLQSLCHSKRTSIILCSALCPLVLSQLYTFEHMASNIKSAIPAEEIELKMGTVGVQTWCRTLRWRSMPLKPTHLRHFRVNFARLRVAKVSRCPLIKNEDIVDSLFLLFEEPVDA